MDYSIADQSMFSKILHSILFEKCSIIIGSQYSDDFLDPLLDILDVFFTIYDWDDVGGINPTMDGFLFNNNSLNLDNSPDHTEKRVIFFISSLKPKIMQKILENNLRFIALTSDVMEITEIIRNFKRNFIELDPLEQSIKYNFKIRLYNTKSNQLETLLVLKEFKSLKDPMNASNEVKWCNEIISRYLSDNIKGVDNRLLNELNAKFERLTLLYDRLNVNQGDNLKNQLYQSDKSDIDEIIWHKIMKELNYGLKRKNILYPIDVGDDDSSIEENYDITRKNLIPKELYRIILFFINNLGKDMLKSNSDNIKTHNGITNIVCDKNTLNLINHQILRALKEFLDSFHNSFRKNNLSL